MPDINIQGRQMGKTTAMILCVLTELRNGRSVKLYSPDAKNGDAMYDRMLKALEADDHLLVESNMKSHRTIHVWSHDHNELTFKVVVKGDTES